MPTNMGGGVRIKSIQHVEHYTGNPNTNATISSVVVANTIIKLVSIWDTSGANVETVALELTSSTNVNVIQTGTSPQIVIFEVIEYIFTKKITYGTVTVTGNSSLSVPLPIGSTPSKCSLQFTHIFVGAIQPLGNLKGLVSGANIAFVNPRPQDAIVKYYVVETI